MDRQSRKEPPMSSHEDFKRQKHIKTLPDTETASGKKNAEATKELSQTLSSKSLHLTAAGTEKSSVNADAGTGKDNKTSAQTVGGPTEGESNPLE